MTIIKHDTANLGLGKPIRVLMLSTIEKTKTNKKYVITIMEDTKSIFMKRYEKRKWADAMYSKLYYQLHKDKIHPYKNKK